MALPSFYQAPIAYTSTTDEAGIALISVKIPGTFAQKADASIDYTGAFAGYDPTAVTSGRYLDKVEFWCDDPTTHGHQMKNMQVSDTDTVIPVPLRAQFAAYPLILSFQDEGIIESDNLKKGLFLFPNEKLTLQALSKIPNFIPSELYLYGEFHAAAATPGIKVFVNFIWGIRNA